MDKPLVSFVTPAKENDFRIVRLLESVKKQNYPKDKIEIIVIDGGSKPEVIEKCREYTNRIYPNKKVLAEGKGMGKDQGIRRARGKYVVIAETDTCLIGTDWINEMIEPLEKDPRLFASTPQLFVDRKDNVVNRYLSYVGVDPFAMYRSLEAQLSLGRINLIDRGNYYQIRLRQKEPYCMGSNGFVFRRELIEKVGDYGQDVEFIARLAKNGFLDFALPKRARVFHANVKNFKGFLKKRLVWTRLFAKLYVDEKKDFQWVTDKRAFFIYVAKNLLLFPNFFTAVKNCFKYRDPAWLLHPFMVFISTVINIYYAFHSKRTIRYVLQK